MVEGRIGICRQGAHEDPLNSGNRSSAYRRVLPFSIFIHMTFASSTLAGRTIHPKTLRFPDPRVSTRDFPSCEDEFDYLACAHLLYSGATGNWSDHLFQSIKIRSGNPFGRKINSFKSMQCSSTGKVNVYPWVVDRVPHYDTAVW